MAMTRDEFKQGVQKMLGFASPDKQAEASELLTSLSDAFEEITTTSENAATQISELTANNETLRAVNAKLFLRVGQTDKDDPTPPLGSEPTPPPSMEFDKLFNDKGELI